MKTLDNSIKFFLYPLLVLLTLALIFKNIWFLRFSYGFSLFLALSLSINDSNKKNYFKLFLWTLVFSFIMGTIKNKLGI